jgi:hypothetical protein
MFDLIVNGHRNTTRRDLTPLVISWAVHSLAIRAVLVLPLILATHQLPTVPGEILTYVTVCCTAAGATASSASGVCTDASCEASFASASTDAAAAAPSTGRGPSRAPARHRQRGAR